MAGWPALLAAAAAFTPVLMGGKHWAPMCSRMVLALALAVGCVLMQALRPSHALPSWLFCTV